MELQLPNIDLAAATWRCPLCEKRIGLGSTRFHVTTPFFKGGCPVVTRMGSVWKVRK